MAFFVEQRDFDDRGIDDLINEEEPFISGTHWARGMSEADAGICTRPIKCKHTVDHYCFIDTVKSECFVRYLISYFRTFEKSAKFKTR